MRRRPVEWLRSRWFWRGSAALALVLVFLSYQQPALMFDLANRVWSCF